ncbi:MAG TPA: OsmC family protein [Chloroflexota bacterium]
MAEELLVNRVQSTTIGIPGRAVSSARTNHLVVDEPPHAGGPGEAITPVEAFLAGVSACGVLLVEGEARRLGVPLQRAQATIEGVRSRSNPGDFQAVNLRFEIVGPTPEQAEQLVEHYKRR